MSVWIGVVLVIVAEVLVAILVGKGIALGHYVAEALSRHEKKPLGAVELELKQTLRYRTNLQPTTRFSPAYEVWGPQRLADRINAA